MLESLAGTGYISVDVMNYLDQQKHYFFSISNLRSNTHTSSTHCVYSTST